MNVYIGIDPGKTGASAMIDPWGSILFLDAEKIELAAFGESILKFISHGPGAFVLLEKAQVMPGSVKRRRFGMPEGEQKPIEQGRVGIFNYGINYGGYLGMLKALRIPYAEVHPMTWKKEFSLLHQPKDASRERAIQLFPQVAGDLKRKRDHGRAEALLLAEFARRKNMGVNLSPNPAILYPPSFSPKPFLP